MSKDFTIIHNPNWLLPKKLICPCGGRLKSTGTIFTSIPPKYQLKCETCGKHESIVIETKLLDDKAESRTK